MEHYTYCNMDEPGKHAKIKKLVIKYHKIYDLIDKKYSE